MRFVNATLKDQARQEFITAEKPVSLMCRLDEQYPGYHFAASKGYASAKHIEAIRTRGLSPVHRASFCGNFLDTPRLF